MSGCGAASHGKQYCNKHINISQRRTLSADLSLLIRSACCDAKCVKGVAHDNGEQYCTACKEPCCWKTGMRREAPTASKNS